jgi:hypothetical protein
VRWLKPPHAGVVDCLIIGFAIFGIIGHALAFVALYGVEVEVPASSVVLLLSVSAAFVLGAVATVIIMGRRIASIEGKTAAMLTRIKEPGRALTVRRDSLPAKRSPFEEWGQRND